MDDGRPWLILLLSVVSLYVSALHQALRDFSRARLENLLGKSDDRRLDRLDASRDDLALATAGLRQVCNLVLILVLARAVFAAIPQASDTVQFLWAAGIGAVLLLTFSVALPFALGRYGGHSLLAWSLPILPLLRVTLWPLLAVLKPFDTVVRRVGGKPEEIDHEVIEEELLEKLTEGEKYGIIEEQEAEMIEGAIHFGDARVGRIMTPRPDIAAVPADAPPQDAARVMAAKGHSRLPVYGRNLDEVLGVVSARDLALRLAEGAPPQPGDLRALMKPALFIPETKPLGELLSEFRVHRVPLAVVLDEYGGTAGLVTHEDLLRTIVGEVPEDAGMPPAPDVRKLADDVYEADGRLRVADLNSELPVELPLELPDAGGYDTVGGFAATVLGYIPKPGEKFRHDGLAFTVLAADERTIRRVRIEIGRKAE